MICDIVPESGQTPTIIYVGQDGVGHWLVQERERRLEGRFVSREAAWSFARAERYGFPGAAVIAAVHPLVASPAFVSPDPRENPVFRAA